MLQISTPPVSGNTSLDAWLQKLQVSLGLAKTEVFPIPVGFAMDGGSPPASGATITSTLSIYVRKFDGATDEDLYWFWQVPYDIVVSSGVKFRVLTFITESTAPSNESWQFEMQGYCFATGGALAGTLGTAQTSNSGLRSDPQYDFVWTAWSEPMTSTHITGLAGGTYCIFKMYRDTDDNDTYAQDVGVALIELKYKRTHDIEF